MSPSPKPPLSLDDLFALHFVGAPEISPDGAKAVYSVKRAHYDENRHETHLFLVPTTGGEPRQLTFGKHGNRSPRWSPDGRTLAFVSNREDKRDQVFLLSMDGGEARKLTDLDGDISEIAWSPAGDKLVMGYNPISEEEKERREAEKKGEADKRQAFKVHTTLHYKEDGSGFLFDRYTHLYTVDAASGKATQITDGATNDACPVFSPDGKTIAFAANRMDEPEYHLDNSDICTVPAAGGSITRVTPKYGFNYAPSFSPDGNTLAFLGMFCPRGGSFWMDLRVYTVPVGGGEPKDLDPKYDRTAGDMTVTDTGDVGSGMIPPVWTPDGKTLYFTASRDGSVVVAKVPAAGGAATEITPSRRHVMGMTADARCGRMALVVSDHTHPAEIAVLDPNEGGEPRLITKHNAPLVAKRYIGEPEDVWVESAPGVKVHGWILKPHGFTAGKKYPAILNVHGGPHAQYGYSFFHEMQHLAGKGYVVMWTNPRGSHGYGEAFTKSIVKDWGGPDYDDIVKVTDHLVALDYVDDKRVGITGGSYGGYMTNWAVGHTDRYKAAVTQRSVVNLYSFYGSSDYGYDFEDEFFGQPWGDEEVALQYLRMSPIHYAKNINTPLLIIHSEEDHRCPVSQAEELFTALKVQKKPVEFVRFEGESHGLSRGGRPKNRRERLKRIGDWFDRFLD